MDDFLELVQYLENTEERIKVIEFEENLNSISGAIILGMTKFIERFCRERHWRYYVRDAAEWSDDSVSRIAEGLQILADSQSKTEKLFKRLVLVYNLPTNADSKLQSSFERLVEVNDDIYVFLSFQQSFFGTAWRMRNYLLHGAGHELKLSAASFDLDLHKAEAVKSNENTILGRLEAAASNPISTAPVSADLKSFLLKNFPLVRKANFDLSELNHPSTIVKGSINDHLNHHLTLFGGSISMVLLVSAMCHLQKVLDTYHRELSFLVSALNVDYQKPVDCDFYAESLEIPQSQIKQLFHELDRQSYSLIKIQSILRRHGKNKEYAIFTGDFYVKVK